MPGKVLRGGGLQFAAVPLRQDGYRLRVMLLTSRDTGRWVLPKGWAEQGLTGPEVAAKEAFEEAGLRGEVQAGPFGTYRYRKCMSRGRVIPCRVEVFAMWVDQVLEDWPERSQRAREWFSPREAARKVQEDGLRLLLEGLAYGTLLVPKGGEGAAARMPKAQEGEG
ncbi:NUDIX hydrolase [Muricoccus vinaceus]|uniref:NUDIX hydrolase n=1 Tax=Muricoccus vinaceus TaxID=424704 RepID=A0ABV6J1Q8_9PROT